MVLKVRVLLMLPAASWSWVLIVQFPVLYKPIWRVKLNLPEVWPGLCIQDAEDLLVQPVLVKMILALASKFCEI